MKQRYPNDLECKILCSRFTTRVLELLASRRTEPRPVHVLMRLKSDQNPRIRRVYVGKGAKVANTCDGAGDDWYYLTTVPREILTVQEVSLAYTLRWDIELLWKYLKTGVGMSAIRAWRQPAVFALVHAKLTAVALARLLEIAAKPTLKEHAMGQLAIVLALSRSIPMIMFLRMRGQNIDLAEMERRILLVATTLAKSRNRRRDRARKAKRAALSTGS